MSVRIRTCERYELVSAHGKTHTDKPARADTQTHTHTLTLTLTLTLAHTHTHTHTPTRTHSVIHSFIHSFHSFIIVIITHSVHFINAWLKETPFVEHHPPFCETAVAAFAAKRTSRDVFMPSSGLACEIRL